MKLTRQLKKYQIIFSIFALNIKTFKPEDYFEGGWLAGIKEFQFKFQNILIS